MSVQPERMRVVTKNSKGVDVPTRRNGYYVLDAERVYPSVTTILTALPKPQLVSWAARMAAEALTEDPSLTVQEAVSAIYKRRDSAGNLGTTVHSWAEALKCGAPISWKDLPEALQGYGRAFEDWAHKEQPKILLKEQLVWSDRLKIAGKTDMVCLLDDDTTCAVVDIKTGSGIYAEAGLQMAMYRLCLNEMRQFHGVEMPPVGHPGLPIPWVNEARVLHLKAEGNYDFPRMEEADGEAVFLSLKRTWEWLQEKEAARDGTRKKEKIVNGEATASKLMYQEVKP